MSTDYIDPTIEACYATFCGSEHVPRMDEQQFLISRRVNARKDRQ